MIKKSRKKDERLNAFTVSDWCGRLSEVQFNEIRSLSNANASSKTTKALKTFFVEGVSAYQVHQNTGLDYSVVNRAIWTLVKRHIECLTYSKKYGKTELGKITNKLIENNYLVS